MSRPMLFGKYCLLERLSVGGMAEVFRAKPLNSPSTDRFLALKRILPHLAEDEEFIKMFVDEAKLCVHLRHPNIVHIFELGKFQSSSYILMEYIPGQDLLALQKRLRQRRLIMSVAQACYVVMELAKGLDYAHKATDDYGRPLNIIHRDVSPQNVLISYGGQVKLIDFGVAKAAVQSTKTQVGVLKGKFGYMSPEQIRGEAIDQRSDIFAAGTVLWELLTNRRLFTGDNEFEIFQKVRDANVDPPSAKNPQIPPEVDRIVMKALTAHPEQRYSYCADLARDLGQFLTSIEPLYTQRHLSDWMARFFEEEFASEQQKIQEFRRIVTADDVRGIYFGAPGGANPGMAPAQQMGAPQPQEETAEATQIWDVDEAPGDGEDIEAFAANHTVVQAGGFDLDDFLQLSEDDLIEVSDHGANDNATMELARLDPAKLRQSVASTPERRDGARAATLDAGGTNPRIIVSEQDIIDATRKRNLRAGLAFVAVLACVGLLFATIVIYVVGDKGGEEKAPETTPDDKVAVKQAPGTIVVTARPVEEVEVFVDGKLRAESTPFTLDDLEPGEHVIEVRHADYETFSTRVDVRSNGFVPIDAELEKK
ncbi:MAG: serine/threonine-protein kinase [Myxococcota bacterium]|nr:serine/threonine-protein kinase [Myxococcota bacterium]